MAKERFNYFDYFCSIAKIACDEAEFLKRMAENYNPANLLDDIGTMHEMEHRADEKKAEMINVLIREFVPPIDRDDITQLSELLDTVCDCIDDVPLHLYMYNITEIRDDVPAICDGIVHITQELYELTKDLEGFHDPDHLLEQIAAVNTVEEEGDTLYLNSMHNLYSYDLQQQVVQAVGWNDLYSALEDCYDACEDAAALIRQIVIENS
jgi:uncharacterized protein Yka (UPF0111/DUF47 family)